MKEIASANAGWDVLYLDPKDKRLWELSYPKSEYHGGGPPWLAYISDEEAVKKYKL